jgi:lipopolysaccharide biosynthesis glycosyltransferase
VLTARWIKRYLALPHDLYVAGAVHPATRELLGCSGASILPRQYPALAVNFEKLQAVGLLTCYDQVLYLDTDVLIQAPLDGIFELPGGLVAAIQPEQYPLHEMFRDRAILPDKTWPYFNSGVVLFNRSRLPDPAWLSCTLKCMLPAVLAKCVPWIYDQVILNLAAATLELNFKDMPALYNACPGVHDGATPALWHFRPPAVKPWSNRAGGFLADWYVQRTGANPLYHPAYDAWDQEHEKFKREVSAWIETP